MDLLYCNLSIYTRRASSTMIARVLFCFTILLSQSVYSASMSVGILGSQSFAHPLIQETDTQNVVRSFSLLPLISLEKNWEWQCRLCVKLPTLENKGIETFTDKTGVQKLAIHLELAEGLFWGDKEPVTLKDLAFTWQAIRQIPTNLHSPNLLQEIENIIMRPQETRHFTVLLRSVTDPYPILSAFFLVSEHLDQAVFNKDRTWSSYFTNSLYVTDAKNPGLYNGPFLISEETADQIVFKRNPLSSVKAELETLNLRMFSSSQDIVKALESNTLDLATHMNVGHEVLNNLQTLNKSEKKYQFQHEDSAYYEHIDFNLQNPMFQDVHVRKALAYAIDKEVLIKKIMQDWAIPAVSPIHARERFFSSDISLYEYSLAKAKKHLAHSDWQLGPEGYSTKKNRTLEFEILTVQDPLRFKMAMYLAEAWKLIGAKVNVVSVSVDEFRERIARRNFSGLALYSWDMTLFMNKKSLYHSASIPSMSNSYSGQNVTGWINSRVDDALVKYANSIHMNDRQRALLTLQQEYTRELPGIPLFFRLEASVLSSRVRNFKTPFTHTGTGLSASSWQLAD